MRLKMSYKWCCFLSCCLKSTPCYELEWNTCGIVLDTGFKLRFLCMYVEAYVGGVLH